MGIRLFFFTFCVSVCCSAAWAQVWEAEDQVLSGTQVSTQRQGYAGRGFVTGFDADGDKVTFNVTMANAGPHYLYIRYAAPSGEKFNFIYVNNQNSGSVQFAASDTFKETRVGKIYLAKGENTIAVVKEWGYFELDNIRLEPAEVSDINHVSPVLVTPNSSVKTVELYNFISKTYGKVILSGQYGGETEFSRIQSISGKTPLIRGFDLIEYSPTRVEHGATSTETEKAIAWDAQRGLVTFAWHWNAPKDLINQPGKEWWRGFYTDATNFDVSKAMNDPSSEEYTLILRDIDVIAVQLRKLKDANVPVLWRPLHEAEGKWFWWGAKGPDACQWLWKLLYDRLANHHQLNNLIWVWTSTGTPAALSWYPGDDFVDVIGADIYLPASTYSSSFITFNNMVSMYGGKKIISLSENGPIPDPDRLLTEGVSWNWFSTWSGEFITDGVSNTPTHINKVFNHRYVITLDELDDIDNIIKALQEEKENEEDEEVVLGVEDFHSLAFSYQNPIRNNRLILKSDGSQPISRVMIYGARGEVEFINENQERSNKLEFNFEGKSDGLYVVKITSSGITKIIRVIKI